MDFRLLGPLEVHENGESLRLGSPKQRALLALLLLRANEVVSREAAIDALWGEDPPEHATNALQVYVHGLRKVLGSDRIELRGTGYLLHVGGGELDLHRFERLVAEGRFDGALELWRGEPLADVTLDAPERARLSELRLRALELDTDARLAAGEHDDLVPGLEALVAEEPLRESFRRQLMLALYRAGRQSDALDLFRATRALFADELGLEPSPALADLERAILRHDPSLQAPARQPKLRLPAPASPFVGRNLDVAAVCAQLRDETRLLTLTGPGGIGKTRLAIEAAATLGSELEDGAIFVDLAPTADPALVPATIAEVVAGEGQGSSALDAAAARLRPRETLLVLDNFERLLDAAPVVSELLDQAPRLRVLVTSRGPLRLAAEREYAVQPIDLDADAVAIFVNRARAADSSFRLTGEDAEIVSAICDTLEGLPLALELAAARVRVLTPVQLLDRLREPLAVLSGGVRDLPERQQTLRATIDWSYDLLEPREQQLFSRLAVFAGGCTLEAAEEVCDAQIDSLSSLLDSSLLRRVQTRFRMLDTVREYALELAHGDAPERHAHYFAEYAERIGADLVGPRRIAALLKLAEEHANLRAALAFSLEHDLDLGFRIAGASRTYWTTAARSREIRSWLECAVAKDDALDTEARVRARLVLGRQLMNSGDYVDAQRVLADVVAAASSLEEWRAAAAALGYLAWLSAVAGDDESCRRFAEQAVDLGRRSHDLWAERQGLVMVAATLINRGDYADAGVYLARSLALARELDDVSTTVLALANSGYGAIAAGEPASARPLLEEALELTRQLDEPPSTVSVLHLLAWEAQAVGEPERARRFLRDALELLRGGGRESHLADVLSEAAIQLEAGAPQTAARLLATADARAPARGAPARRRYDVLRKRLEGGVALTPEEAIAEAIASLDAQLRANRARCCD